MLSINRKKKKIRNNMPTIEEIKAKMNHLINHGLSEQNANLYRGLQKDTIREGADGNYYALVREADRFYRKVAPKTKNPELLESYEYIGGYCNRRDNEYKDYNLAVKQFEFAMREMNEAKGAGKPFGEIVNPSKRDETIAKGAESMRGEMDRAKKVVTDAAKATKGENVSQPTKNETFKKAMAPFTEAPKESKATASDPKSQSQPFGKKAEVSKKNIKEGKECEGTECCKDDEKCPKCGKSKKDCTCGKKDVNEAIDDEPDTDITDDTVDSPVDASVEPESDIDTDVTDDVNNTDTDMDSDVDTDDTDIDDNEDDNTVHLSTSEFVDMISDMLQDLKKDEVIIDVVQDEPDGDEDNEDEGEDFENDEPLEDECGSSFTMGEAKRPGFKKKRYRTE